MYVRLSLLLNDNDDSSTNMTMNILPIYNFSLCFIYNFLFVPSFPSLAIPRKGRALR